MKDLLFVYGTLKQGYGNHNYILKDQKFLGEARTSERYFMWGKNAGFPYISRLPYIIYPKLCVLGELYEVDPTALAECDRLEGHPHFYERHEIDVVTIEDNKKYIAWIYEITNPRYFSNAMDTRICDTQDACYYWEKK